MSKNTTTIRISSDLHGILKHLAEQASVSMQDILEEALERYRRDRFLEQLNQDFSSCAQYAEEVADLDGTVADGLEDNET